MRTYRVEFEIDEWIDGQLSYAGAQVALIHAENPKHAARIFEKHIHDAPFMLTEQSHFGIFNIPRRPGLTYLT